MGPKERKNWKNAIFVIIPGAYIMDMMVCAFNALKS